MNHKEAIMEAAITLINEKGNRLEDITMREISKRAGVGLGLINYHFESKEKLIEACVEQIVNGIVEKFRSIGAATKKGTPFEKLDYLGNMTLTFLFEHEAVSRISILSDMRFPREDDNTQRTTREFIPLVAACRPDWDEKKVREVAFCLIAGMQSAFLRQEMILETQGIDLKEPGERRAFHTRLLKRFVGTDGAAEEDAQPGSADVQRERKSRDAEAEGEAQPGSAGVE